MSLSSTVRQHLNFFSLRIRFWFCGLSGFAKNLGITAFFIGWIGGNWLIGFSAWSDPIYNVNRSVRALGMGNAYAAVVDNADSLFYNPAGLAQVSGVHWTVFDLGLGASGAEVVSKVQDLQGSDSFADTVNALYGERVWLGADAKSAITLPFVGFAVYDSLDASLEVNNPVYPTMDIGVINDLGYSLGFGVPILPLVHVGATIRRITRKGARAPFGPSFIASLDPSGILDNIEKEGTGFAADLGLNIRVPGPVSPTLSAVWRNLGKTKFTPTSDLGAPPTEEDDMTIGASLGIDAGLISIVPAFEIKHLNRNDVQLGKKIHFGVELGLPLLDIRGGFYQGYYTLGAGLNLGLLQLDVATYGVEMGEYPGQLEDRRYALQLTLELGIDMGLGFLGSSSGGSGGSGGRSGRRGLKQRR